MKPDPARPMETAGVLVGVAPTAIGSNDAASAPQQEEGAE